MNRILNVIGKSAAYKNKIYFVSQKYNWLCSIEDNLFKIKYECKLPKNNWKISDCYEINGLIYVVCLNKAQIAVYKNDKLYFYDFIDINQNNVCTYYKDENIWFIPKNIKNEIIIYNIKIRKFQKINKYFNNNIVHLKSCNITDIFIDDKQMILIMNDGKVLINKENLFHIIDIKIEGTIKNIVKIKKTYYLAVVHGDYQFIYEYKKNNAKEIFRKKLNKYIYLRLINENDKLFMTYSKNIFVYENNKFVNLQENEICSYNYKGSTYMNSIYKNNNIYLFPWNGDKIIIYNCMLKNSNIIDLLIDSSKWLEENKIVEEKDISLNEYINVICGIKGRNNV